MPRDDLKLAKELQVKAEHYASAFRLAAEFIRARTDDVTGEMMAAMLEVKAELEEAFAARLKDNPLGTIKEEGI